MEGERGRKEGRGEIARDKMKGIRGRKKECVCLPAESFMGEGLGVKRDAGMNSNSG